VIGTYFRGRLGNNMYQYAYIRSVSERKKIDFCIYDNGRGNSSEFFDDTFPHLKYNKNVNMNGKFMEEVHYDLKSEFYDLSDNVITFGFFQNYKYFKRVDVKKWFDIYLDDEQNKEFDDYLKMYDPNEYCYINYRGTDFATPNHPHVTYPEFYMDAKTKVKSKKFLIITDDIENAKKNVEADSYIAPIGKIGMKLLTKSKELIIPAWSTFGWWGAWLSDSNLIIAPDIEHICYIKNDKFDYIIDRGRISNSDHRRKKN